MRRLETRISGLLSFPAAFEIRFFGPVPTSEHTPSDLNGQPFPFGMIFAYTDQHLEQVVFGIVPICGELLRFGIVTLRPPLICAPPRIQTRVVHFRAHAEHLCQATMPRRGTLHPQPERLNQHLVHHPTCYPNPCDTIMYPPVTDTPACQLSDISPLSYTTPVLSLLWLRLFSNIDVARPDYVIMGASAIIAVNLVLNINPERNLPVERVGFKGLILSLWLFGVYVYLRDRWFTGFDITWRGVDYWAAIALSSTVFALILSFRMSRLNATITAEDGLVIGLLRKMETLHRHGTVNSTGLDLLVESLASIDTSTGGARLQRAYSQARRVLGEPIDSESEGTLLEVERDLDALVHSKQADSGFGEMLAVAAFGLLTVGLALMARPAVEGWSGFLVEGFSVLFASTIMFLLFNLL